MAETQITNETYDLLDAEVRVLKDLYLDEVKKQFGSNSSDYMQKQQDCEMDYHSIVISLSDDIEPITLNEAYKRLEKLRNNYQKALDAIRD